MHKLEKAVLESDHTAHEHEEAIVSLFTQADSEAGGAVKEARAAGMKWQDIIGLLVQYGPQFAAIIQAILAAWNSKPPEVKTPVAAEKSPSKVAESHKRGHKAADE